MAEPEPPLTPYTPISAIRSPLSSVSDSSSAFSQSPRFSPVSTPTSAISAENRTSRSGGGDENDGALSSEEEGSSSSDEEHDDKNSLSSMGSEEDQANQEDNSETRSESLQAAPLASPITPSVPQSPANGGEEEISGTDVESSPDDEPEAVTDIESNRSSPDSPSENSGAESPTAQNSDGSEPESSSSHESVSRKRDRSREIPRHDHQSSQKRSRRRSPQQEAARYLARYVIPVVLAIPLSLLLHLVTQLLNPLYNSLPLSLNSPAVYGAFSLMTTLVYWGYTSYRPARTISARVCLSLIAISSDLIVVFGRMTGSLCGLLFGPQWGAWTARAILGLGVVGGATAFALLCYDHAIPIPSSSDRRARILNFVNVGMRCFAYILHIYYAQRLWTYLLSGRAALFIQRPEKAILFISMLLTSLSLFVRSSPPTSSIPNQVHSFISLKLSLKPRASRQLARVTAYLPHQSFPTLLVLRLPLLVLALRQQLYLRPMPPYTTADGRVRILHSEQSLAGQVVVGDNTVNGYRYMRVDASLVGGRWFRPNGNMTVLGDSVFSTFPMQEIGVLAVQSDSGESLARTISMTTELQVEEEDPDEGEDKSQDRALIIGLGAGIAAMAMSKRGLAVDIVEIDPVIYETAKTHFNLTLPESSTVNILPADSYIAQMSAYNRESNGTLQRWRYVVHDCFSAGALPMEAYTREFWEELTELVEVDGVVSVNVAGLYGSLAARKIIVTLLSVFSQCRAFGDLPSQRQHSKELVNMVVLCTMAHSPLLSFRPPNKHDVMRSPLRSHVYSTFHAKEIQLDSMISDPDWDDPDMVLSTNSSSCAPNQLETSLAFWRAMQRLMSREMWLIW